MKCCILGRQPEIGLFELETLYGAERIQLFGGGCALVDADIDFARLGGSVKVADVVATTTLSAAFRTIQKLLPQLTRTMPAEGKIKLGLSAYGFDVTPYQLGGEALRLKKQLRSSGRSVRVVPNDSPALSSAQTYHNALTSDLGLEFVIAASGDKVVIGRVTDVQHIDSYRIRDRDRPKRDAFVGMLPPKLAQVLVNLAVGEEKISGPADQEIERKEDFTVFDPFCGTGVVLQEAALMGYSVIGSDISPKMIDYATANLEWLQANYHLQPILHNLEVADATTYTWPFLRSSDLAISRSCLVVASEVYLGQPLGGQHPTEEKIRSIVHDTNQIARGFLANLAPQLAPGTRLCLALPAWYVDGHDYHLPLLEDLDQLGYTQHQPAHTKKPVVYRREDQITAREIVVLVVK